MTSLPLLLCTWDGDSLIPAQGFKQRCDELLVVDEKYRVEMREERSINSHNHYFAAIDEAWRNLPELWSERFPTPDHLRRWCLIKAGFRDERTIVAKSNTQARAIAVFVKPLDDYAVCVARDNVVVVWTAKSQSGRAMGKKDFQTSKEAVLRECAELIGVTPAKLRDNTERAA